MLVKRASIKTGGYLIIVLVVDPGETTGYVVAEADGLDYDIKISGQFPHWRMLETLITYWIPDVIVYEAFYLSPQIAKYKTRSTMPTVEVIGVLKYLAWKCTTSLVAQSPSAKELILLPRYIAGISGPHARDALKHLIAYLRLRGGNQT